MSTWEDVTSYSRGEKDRTHKAWAIQLGRFRLTILCHHRYYAENPQWVMHLPPLYDTHPLNLPAPTPTTNLEEAKGKALGLVHNVFFKALEAVHAEAGSGGAGACGGGS